MTSEDISNRFRYHPPATREKQDAHAAVRAACAHLAHELNDLIPDGRERNTAIAKVEEAMFWANAALARTGQEPAPA